MNTKEYLISRLASFLKVNGENVISGTSKLSLTTSALCLLNAVFVDILLHDQFESNNCTENRFSQEFFEDAQYLKDFVRNTPSLKLFHGMQTLRGGVDLSQFVSLSVLELRKIPTHLIVGLTTLSSQLKALICNRSISSLKELFGNCAEEAGLAAIWTELKELNVSYNYLEELDESLKIMPNIEIFDASRNSLKHLDELLMLDKLIVLNLSYNTLDHLPVLSCSSSSSLKVLFIRNNNLEDLAGLENLINLEEFDASYNCLSEYHVLKPLEKLKSLKSLQLASNPFCLYKRHREVILKYLHPRTINNGFYLDRTALSPKEMLSLNCNPLRRKYSGSPSGHQTSINIIVEDIANVTARSDQHCSVLRNASVDKEVSIGAVLKENRSSASSFSENTDEDSLVRKVRGKLSNRKQREAVIVDPGYQHETPVPVPVFIKPAEEVPSHIQTKELLEKRRKEYGTEWLLPSHSFQALVSDSVIPSVPANTPVSSVPNNFPLSHQRANLPSQLPVIKLQFPIATALDVSTQIKTSGEEYIGSPKKLPTDPKDNEVDSPKVDAIAVDKDKRKHSITSDDIQVLTSHVADEALDWTHDSNELEQETAMYAWGENYNDTDFGENDTFGDDDSEESEDRIFILERKEKDKVYPLFVSLVGNFAKEKDFGTGKVSDLLDLKNLLSVNLTTSLEGDIFKHEIHLSFDCLKVSKLKRLYISDNEESAKHMVSLLQPFADAKALEDTTVGALECLKCSSQFSKQVADRKILKTKKPHMGQEPFPSSYDSSKGYIQETEVCPNCGSNMVVEMDTIPIPSMQPPIMEPFTNRREKHSVKNSKKEVPGCRSLPGSPSMGNQFYKLLSSSPVSSKHAKGPVASTSFKSTDLIGNNSPKSIDENNLSHYETDSSMRDSFRKQIRSDSDSTLVLQMRRNSSDITILSNISQSSVAVMSFDSEGGLTLDAIPEKDSLCSPTSTSPTLSHPDLQKNKLPPKDCTTVLPGTTTKSTPQLLCSSSKPAYCKVNDLEQTSPLASKNSSSQDCSENFQDCVESFGKNSSSASCTSQDCVNESTRIIDLLANREIVNYENFSSIDHRLKLHLEFSVFGNHEMLDACLESSIVPLTTGEEFRGFYVISNKKIYIMKLLKEIDEDVEKCVQQLHSWPLNQLKVVSLLLGSQGFITTTGADNKIHTFIIRDADYCNCFIAYLTDIIRQHLQGTHIPKFETSTKEALNQLNKEVILVNCTQASSVESEFEVVLYLLVFWMNNETDKSNLQPVAIVVTQSDFFVASLQFEKLASYSKQPKRNQFHYVPLEEQKISNLVDIQIHENLKEAELHFLDEDHNRVCQWYVVTQSKSSLFSLINSFKNPWEETFGIELPLCIKQ